MGNGGTDPQNVAPKKKSPYQLALLEVYYNKGKYPTHIELDKYAETLNLTYKQTRIWFKERRRRERREDGHANDVQRQLTARTSADCQPYGCDHRIIVQNKIKPVKRRYRQALLPKDYILRKIFRKDGPPLGSEFDSPSTEAVNCQEGSDTSNLLSKSEDERPRTRRKISKLPTGGCEAYSGNNPSIKHGTGKGLMTIWHVIRPRNGELPTGLDISGSSGTLVPLHGEGKNSSSPIVSQKKSEKKRKAPSNKRKELRDTSTDLTSNFTSECNLLIDEVDSLHEQDENGTIVDDEELELRELRAGPNPMSCSAHLTSGGRHGCSLCKDLLGRFPPPSVKMKLPFSIRPWESSPELVKKLFKVIQYLHRHSSSIDASPFTFDEILLAFHDKESLLLGKVHVALLKRLLFNVNGKSVEDFIPCSSEESRFLRFLHFVREQKFDADFWGKSLNPMTWVEILRQVLIAAGYGSKHNMWNRDNHCKEKNQMVKYGLRPHTLKGELFALLSKTGSVGMKISELAESTEIVDLGSLKTVEELQQSIYSILSSDITLFEKIGQSAYRVRVFGHNKGKMDQDSDTDDAGSVEDDDCEAAGVGSGDDSDEIRETSSSQHSRSLMENDKYAQLLSKNEIDESFSGNSWIIGLMEGEYADLSIAEKLDALIALIDLVYCADSILQNEGQRQALPSNLCARVHGSGAKVKRSMVAHHQPSDASLNSSADAASLDIHEHGQSSGKESGGSASHSGKDQEHIEPPVKATHIMQAVYLGSDRRYNKYWLFLGPCTLDDPGHRRVYFESSEDGHWEVIDTAQDLLALLAVLDSRGLRESRLLASIRKRQAFLCKVMEGSVKDCGSARQACLDPVNSETSSGGGLSPLSDIDNNVTLEPTSSFVKAPCPVVLNLRSDEKRIKWDQLQAFDKWSWTSFYAVLNSVKHCKRSFVELLTRCESCHDLYWRDEKHCSICHSTFEIDFDLEERYAIHVATCREAEYVDSFPNNKILPSQLQVLKAAIHAVEAAMPKKALVATWMKSAHKLWVKRLQRTSSLPGLLQVLVDFVGAINEDWLYENSPPSLVGSYLDDITVYFQTMPQTTSAVALWVTTLDAVIAPHLERPNTTMLSSNNENASKGKRLCTRRGKH